MYQNFRSASSVSTSTVILSVLIVSFKSQIPFFLLFFHSCKQSLTMSVKLFYIWRRCTTKESEWIHHKNRNKRKKHRNCLGWIGCGIAADSYCLLYGKVLLILIPYPVTIWKRDLFCLGFFFLSENLASYIWYFQSAI